MSTTDKHCSSWHYYILQKKKKIKLNVFVHECMHSNVGAGSVLHTYAMAPVWRSEDLRSWFSPSIMWYSGTELRLAKIATSAFTR